MVLVDSFCVGQDWPQVLLFFSSRRRHTRCSRDWSSDVCSSDLVCVLRGSMRGHVYLCMCIHALISLSLLCLTQQIGRASCRERV